MLKIQIAYHGFANVTTINRQTAVFTLKSGRDARAIYRTQTWQQVALDKPFEAFGELLPGSFIVHFPWQHRMLVLLESIEHCSTPHELATQAMFGK
jgi:hypothetical protein